MDAILKASLPKLREKLLEALQAVLPIVAIVLVLCFTIAPISPSILLCFLLGAAMIIVGIMNHPNETVAAFSMDELAYSETLADWRTHDGMDLAALAGEPVPPLPPLAERCDALVRQIERSAEFRNEKVALLEARRHYCWYLKGVKYANYYKDQINHMETLEDLYRVTAGIKRDLSD